MHSNDCLARKSARTNFNKFMPSKLHLPKHEETGEYTRVAVFGAGLSGRSARSLAMDLGFEVCMFDEGGQGDVPEFGSKLLGDFDAFIFSPGFAATHPWRVLAEGSSKPCYNELGFAALHWNGCLIGITGTNGKTSLTLLVSQALKDAGIHSVTAGNIGVPLSDFVLSESNQESTYAVCEISSFQAELTRGLQLDGLIWTNFAEDHLDRHTSMEEYFAANRKLIGCLRPVAPAILGASVHAFDASVSDATNVFVVDENLQLIQQLAPDSPLRKQPQLANFTFAAALWRHLGFSEESLISSANSFQTIKHRFNRVAEWNGVSFWNDSKATNFHAALAAMDSVDGDIYWIGGGSYKGGDLGAFARSAASKTRMAFLYGAVAEEMADHFRKTESPFELHFDFCDAVKAAAEAALKNAPSVVLLSPGFASFDQFSGYAARGNVFTSTILKLKDNYCTD